MLSLSWTGDGQKLALGMYNGQVLICDKNGVEQVRKWNFYRPIRFDNEENFKVFHVELFRDFDRVILNNSK